MSEKIKAILAALFFLYIGIIATIDVFFKHCTVIEHEGIEAYYADQADMLPCDECLKKWRLMR